MIKRSLSGFAAALGIFLAVHVTTPLSAETGVSDLDILKKISSASIRKALADTGNINEIAAQIGVSTNELKRICLALRIDLPAPPPPPARPEPVPMPVTVPPVTTATPTELVTDAIMSYYGESPYVLLVDKDQHFLYLLKYDNGKRIVEEVFPCKTGRSIGDKQERGDQRTPEGIYFFQIKYTRQEIERRVGKVNAFQYGDMAFTSDFPNRIDELKGKSGGGIWLHGTDEPFESTPSLDTRGCVVTTNETIRKLSPYIELDKTPLVIVDKLMTQSDAEIEAERRSILAMVEDWRKTWAEKRIDDYISHYSASFSSQGLSREQWKARKEGLAKINGTVTISLQNISILKQKDGMVVRFIQDYEADNVANIGIKTLYLIRGEKDWEIVSEHFRKTQ